MPATIDTSWAVPPEKRGNSVVDTAEPGAYARVVMLFDGGCPLCNREVAHYKGLDTADRVEWIDITQYDDLSADFGVNHQAAMARLHVIDRLGRIQTGVQAFVTLWEVLPGYRHLAALVKTLRLEKPLELLYGRFAARRLKHRCREGACSLRGRD